MSRVITFSRTFPAYHPRAGEPTYFVEKLYKSILKPTDHVPITGIESGLSLFALADAQPKHHTIRAGHRWKVGDWFSPRVWSGKPYNSKQIVIAPDIQVKKVWDFEMDKCGVCAIAKPGKQVIYTFEYDDQWPDSLDNDIAKNDGLTPADFYFWFSRSPEFKRSEDGFSGQIICWNENIEYI
jgi:hypothetical protein